MQDWNPELYMQFSAERTRPAQELVARIAARLNVKQAYDLGCGPGNSTELLRKAWPQANITGVDTSPAMLAKARRALPDCHFVEQDVLRWRPDEPADLIYANASLQWLPDHASLFPRLASLLAP
ncbi:methyltransferase domain-containing protein, partial [Franconibacter pulveris]